MIEHGVEQLKKEGKTTLDYLSPETRGKIEALKTETKGVLEKFKNPPLVGLAAVAVSGLVMEAWRDGLLQDNELESFIALVGKVTQASLLAAVEAYTNRVAEVEPGKVN